MIIRQGPVSESDARDLAPLHSLERWAAVSDDGRELCVAILASWDERRFACFQVKQTLSPREGARVVLAMRKRLRDIEGPVYSGVDASRFPRAERLDALLGFQPTEDMIGTDGQPGMRVWKWQKPNC